MIKLPDLDTVIDFIEDGQDLLEPNSERMKDEWSTLGYPTAICENNPYKLLWRASEGIRIPLVAIRYISKYIGG